MQLLKGVTCVPQEVVSDAYLRRSKGITSVTHSLIDENMMVIKIMKKSLIIKSPIF